MWVKASSLISRSLSVYLSFHMCSDREVDCIWSPGLSLTENGFEQVTQTLCASVDFSMKQEEHLPSNGIIVGNH